MTFLKTVNFTKIQTDLFLNLYLYFFLSRPDLIDMDTVAVQSNITNLENAFYVAEKLGVTRLLDPEGKFISYRKYE